MTETGYFVVGLSSCFVITLSIIVVIHRRFFDMMVDLCEGEVRARFWTLAVEAWFFLYSITSALKWRPEGTVDRQLFLASIDQIKSGLNGMSNAIILFSAGLLFFVFIRKFKGREKEA
jgi:hypothetical protein